MALPRCHRLRGRRAIDRLHRQGRRLQGPHLLLRLVPADPAVLHPDDRAAPQSPWRCALVISSKVSKRAVVRNRLRRLLHHHLLGFLPGPVRGSRVQIQATDSGEGQKDLRDQGPSADGQDRGPGQPLWLLLSLRPGCAELPPDQLLKECSDLLRRAGLNP